jgi:PIN domain
LEVENILIQFGEKAVDDIRKSIALLKHLSGNQMLSFMAPNHEAIQNGMRARWTQLDGVIQRVAFTHDHARSALRRIITKSPPSGDNNEQFRDCCIWEATLEVAEGGPVHLITNDAAFYEGRDRARGLARQLEKKVRDKKLDVNIYSKIQDFLSMKKDFITILDTDALASKIMQAVLPAAREIVAMENDKGRNDFVLGQPLPPRIQGFATPKPTVFAVSFEIIFPLQNRAPKRADATLELEGTCSYVQSQGEVAEIDLNAWSVNLTGSEDINISTGWHKPERLGEFYSNIRMVK